MHTTEIKTEPVIQAQQLQHHGHNQSSSGSPGRRMTNGDGVLAGGSRPHREVSSSTSGGGMVVSSNECAGCGKRITDRFLLKALDLFWHEDCLKCGCCDCRLGEVGSTLYTKANLILCKRDYLRLFGNTGYCAACSKVIPAFEMVMRARNNVYHLECFACQQCNHRFCVGDRFYLCENKILCEYDYEERMVFANMACSPGSLALLRRQVSNFQQPGLQSEQHNQQQQHHELQQPQLEQQPFSGSNSIYNVVDQYDQFDEQQQQQPQLEQSTKQSLYFTKAPASESRSIGSYGEPHDSSLARSPSPPPPSSSSPPSEHCSETGYITKQEARVGEHSLSDPFVSGLNVASPSLPAPSAPPSKRPKSSYFVYNCDNLLSASSASSPFLVVERNNNSCENLSKPLVSQSSFPMSVIAPAPLHLVQHQTTTPEDPVMHFITTTVTPTAPITNPNNNGGSSVMTGSPDSGIVEGP